MTAPSRKAPTTLATWPATILRALAARGIDSAPIATRAGIDPTQLGLDARVPRSALDALWVAAVDATGDPAFGLDAVRFVGQTTFHALGYAVLASATLREAFERVIRHRRLIGDVLDLALEDVGDRTRLRIDVSAHPGIPFQAVDAVAAICCRQSRMLCAPRPCNPLAVSFARPAPRDEMPYRRTFRCPVRFAAEFDGLEYSRGDLEAPLAAGNAELARANDAVVVRYLSRLDHATVASRVQQAILDALPNGAPAKGMVARQLGMSPRNLQRRLAEEGRSFQSLLDEARVSLARSYVEEGRLTVTEIAFVLGFADTSAFSRAFKRWTGKSPRAHAVGRSRG